MVRIITGTAKGLRLRVVGQGRCRPTPDRLKESMFSVLGNNFDNITVLDLFAGTGSLGLEALSRNCEFTCFVENNHERVCELKDQIRTLGFENRAVVVEMNALKAGKILSGNYGPFSMIFADPPYDWLETHQAELFDLIERYKLFQEEGFGIFAIESSKKTMIQNFTGPGWKTEKRIRSATSKITIMLREY